MATKQSTYVLLASVILIFFLAGISAVAADEITCTNGVVLNSSDENWEIGNETICAFGNLTLNGNLTINATGHLTLANFTLQFNSTVNNILSLTVNTSGTLSVVNNTNITANDTLFGYNWYYLQGSTGYINDSTIGNTYNGSGSDGLNLRSAVSIWNTSFLNGTGYAITVNSTTPALRNLRLTNNTNGINVHNATIILQDVDIVSPEITSTEIRLNSSVLTALNVTFNQTLTEINVSSTLSRQWYVDVVAHTSLSSLQIAGATVTATSVPTSTTTPGFTATTQSTTGQTGYQNVTVFNQTNSAFTVLTNYTFNVSKGNNWNTSTINISSNNVGANNVTLEIYEAQNSVALTASTRFGNVTPGGRFLSDLTITNNGNDWDFFNLSDNSTTANFVISYANTSTNITSTSTAVITMLITVPSTAQPDTTYYFNVTANSTGKNTGNANTTSLTFNVTVDSRTNIVEYGKVNLNASKWLESNWTGNMWHNSNYSTAWAMWAMNITGGANKSMVNHTLNTVNFTQQASGAWIDGVNDNNITTALMMLAHNAGGFSNGESERGNLTLAANQLHAQANFSVNYTWPEDGARSFDTAVILAALYKTNLDNVNDTNASNWLIANYTNVSSRRVSWDNNITLTAWSLWVMQLAEQTGQEHYARGIRYLQDNQSIHGYFGTNDSIEETAQVVYILNQINANSTWTVDRDGNESTVNDQYAGSSQRAIDWIISKRNTTTGGWGNSPANATLTGMAMLATGTYGTIDGRITGEGNATGWNNLSGINVFFYDSNSNTYNATTNGTGDYSLSLPIGAYTGNFTDSTYYHNTTTSVTLLSGQNATSNMEALPQFAFASNVESSASDFIDDADDSVDEGTSVLVGGTVTYKHTGLGFADFTVTITGTASAGSTAFAEATNTTNSSGDFRETLTAPAVSSDLTYTLLFSATDGNSTWGVTDTIDVKNAGSGTTDDTPVAAAGGSGGGSTASYSLGFTQADTSISLTQGETKTVQIKVKNNGAKTIENVRLSLSGFKSDWYKARVTGTDTTREDLSVNEIVTYDVTFTVPSTAEALTYSAVWSAKDDAGNAQVEKSVKIIIQKIWTAASVTTLEGTLEAFDADIKALEEQIEKAKKRDVDVTTFEADLAIIKSTLADAQIKFDAKDYSNAETLTNNARVLLDDLTVRVEASVPKLGLGEALSKISIGNVGLIVLVILVAGAAGGAAWYLFFRVLTITEITKNPARFATGGARIEGVIKQITETKKGKVFLIHDSTGTLHVRYPYYTTVGKGDIVRASGLVKTYKETPYMESSDLHRVSVKHSGN